MRPVHVRCLDACRVRRTVANKGRGNPTRQRPPPAPPCPWDVTPDWQDRVGIRRQHRPRRPPCDAQALQGRCDETTAVTANHLLPLPPPLHVPSSHPRWLQGPPPTHPGPHPHPRDHDRPRPPRTDGTPGGHTGHGAAAAGRARPPARAAG